MKLNVEYLGVYCITLFFACLKLSISYVIYKHFLRLVTQESTQYNIQWNVVGGAKYKLYKVHDSNFLKITHIHREDSLEGNALKW